MALTALDIQQQRFRTKVRGIDPKEVQHFSSRRPPPSKTCSGSITA